jgi:hypothetical protein
VEKKPCQTEYDEFVKAMNEWVVASNALQTYAATGPLDPHQDVTPIPFEEFSAALERSKVVYEDYLEKLDTYFQCLEDHR